jgi:hypothetical protein
MNKIPVFQTIGRAYGFTFGNLATIIGLVWLPLLIQTVGGYLISVRYMGAIQALLIKGDFSALGGIAGQAYLFFFGSLFLTAVMSAPVLRQALGLRQGGAYVYFWPGANEFRLFGANFAVALMLIAIIVLMTIATLLSIAALGYAVQAVGALSVAGISAKIVLGWCVIVLLCAFLGSIVFVLVRLSFLVGPVTIAERKIDLVRAWSLTRGNFWRIFIILLATSLPLLAISWAVEWAFFGTFGSTPAYVAPSQPGPDFVARTMAAQFLVLQKRMPIMIGITLFLAPLRLGLNLGAASFAYRALVPPAAPDHPAAEPVAEDSSAGDLRSNDLAQAAAAS